MHNTGMIIVALTLLSTSSAIAAPITWTGASGMSVMSNPNAMSVLNTTVLTPQNTDLRNKESAKQSAAALAASRDSMSSESFAASMITQQVQNNIASMISQNITNQNGNAPASGLYNIGNNQTISYTRTGGNTNVTIQQLGKDPINLSFPTIQ